MQKLIQGAGGVQLEAGAEGPGGAGQRGAGHRVRPKKGRGRRAGARSSSPGSRVPAGATKAGGGSWRGVSGGRADRGGRDGVGGVECGLGTAGGCASGHATGPRAACGRGAEGRGQGSRRLGDILRTGEEEPGKEKSRLAPSRPPPGVDTDPRDGLGRQGSTPRHQRPAAFIGVQCCHSGGSARGARGVGHGGGVKKDRSRVPSCGNTFAARGGRRRCSRPRRAGASGLFAGFLSCWM